MKSSTSPTMETSGTSGQTGDHRHHHHCHHAHALDVAQGPGAHLRLPPHPRPQLKHQHPHLLLEGHPAPPPLPPDSRSHYFHFQSFSGYEVPASAAKADAPSHQPKTNDPRHTTGHTQVNRVFLNISKQKNLNLQKSRIQESFRPSPHTNSPVTSRRGSSRRSKLVLRNIFTTCSS